MADYAYKDENRTQKIYANDKDIINYKGKRCWCKNPNCNAKMFIVTPEYPDDAFFRASSKVPHIGSCGSECHHFDKKQFDPNLFKFPDVLINLEKKNKKSLSNMTIQLKPEVSTGSKPIKTLRQLYLMCTNTPIEDKYGDYIIGNIIADIRNFSDNLDGINGYRIVECNFYRYDKKTLSIYFNYPYFPQNKYSIQVQFEQLDLFNKMLNRIFPLRHEGIIVISGNWSLTNNNEIDSKVKSKCGIFSEKQIAIIKKE